MPVKNATSAGVNCEKDGAVALVTTVLLTEIEGWSLVARGKVRDLYQAGDEQLLFVATDRISAFDCVLPNGIPRKGEVLTRISLFWFELLKSIVPNHLITANVAEYPAQFRNAAELLEGRSMLVRKAQMFPVECVVRGYLAGSGWKDYKRTSELCGIKLAVGLRESDRLPEPLFTPATKEASGHDINISFDAMAELTGLAAATKMRDLSLALYRRASEWAESRGIIIADTKFEMGVVDGQIVLADEVLTPDSSRFWPREGYAPGGPQPSFDKQFVRDYLETLTWNKQPPAPQLPDSVVERTSAKYQEAFRLLTGRAL
jgi:phosphoribosylaminoimidazole-succinocarboxamide synthase